MKTGIINSCIHIAASVGVIVYIWYLKWREKHPRVLTDVAETDAEISAVQFQKRWLWSPKEEAKATIYASYLLESGKKVTGQLQTYPVRKQLEMYAPELMQRGTKIQIKYDRKHCREFYFTDPRYAIPEVSGEPRKVRIGYFTMTFLSLMILALCAFTFYLTIAYD